MAVETTQASPKDWRACDVANRILAPAGDTLSILIPTYNRAAELEGLLAELMAQREAGLEDAIDITVCDNASTDGTIDLVQPLAEAGHISLYVHSENIGAVPQLFVCPPRARAPWCWVMGDDDLLAPGALTTIIETLRRDQPDFLSLNRQIRDRDLKNIEKDISSTAASQSFASYLDLCQRFSPYQLGFISCQIFRAEPFVATDPAPYMTRANGFAHLGVYLEAFHDKPAQFLSDPLVWHRFGNWDDHLASLKKNFVDLCCPLVDVMETARTRLGLGPEIWQSFAAGEAIERLQGHHVPLEQLVLENAARAVACGHMFSDQEWAELAQVAQHWGLKTQEALKLVKGLEQELKTLVGQHQNLRHQIERQGAPPTAQQLQTAQALEQNLKSRRTLLSGLAAQIYSVGLDQIIRTPDE